MQFYMLFGPTHPLFAYNTQWECIGGLPPPPLGAYVLNERPLVLTFYRNDVKKTLQCAYFFRLLFFVLVKLS